MAVTTPDTPSSDYEAMAPYWTMVTTILGGADRMRDAGKVYLPQFPAETPEDYEYRRTNARLTNIYADIVSTLAAKPFGEELSLVEGAPEAVGRLVEDIDGQGNNLHVFASQVFFGGLNNGVDWILVDYSRAALREDGKPLNRAEERAQGLRPYWVRIPADRLLAVYSGMEGGEEVVIHARIREDVTRRVGFGEESIERIRVLDREPIHGDGERIVGYGQATFAIYEKRAGKNGRSSTWEIVDQGVVTLGVIPLIPFLAGRRPGGSWRVDPPMKPAAELQVEHYQQETALKSITELTAFPMLTGNGVTPPNEGIEIGPRAVLYAPANPESTATGSWSFIEPSGSSLDFLAKQIEATEKQLRELGRQPLMATTGITVVAAAYASQKASSVLKAWAIGLKDALELALKYTAMWLGENVEPTVSWNLDDLDLDARDDDGSADLMAARSNGDLSQETLWFELKRRGKLSADFDPEQERERLAQEMPGDDMDEDVRASLPPEREPGDDREDKVEREDEAA